MTRPELAIVGTVQRFTKMVLMSFILFLLSLDKVILMMSQQDN